MTDNNNVSKRMVLAERQLSYSICFATSNLSGFSEIENTSLPVTRSSHNDQDLCEASKFWSIIILKLKDIQNTFFEISEE